jgi:hypothetical protein
LVGIKNKNNLHDLRIEPPIWCNISAYYVLHFFFFGFFFFHKEYTVIITFILANKKKRILLSMNSWLFIKNNNSQWKCSNGKSLIIPLFE